MSSSRAPNILPWIILSAIVIIGLSKFSYGIILIAQFVLCGYLCHLFRTKISFLFLMFPILVFLFGQAYQEPFLTLGDGVSYVSSARNLYKNYLTNPNKIWFDLVKFPNKILFYFHHIGATPQVVIVDQIWGVDSDPRAYYYFQAYLLLLYASVIAWLSVKWNIFSLKLAEVFCLFVVLSPTFFELGVAVTRHYFTFFSLTLMYISLCSIKKSLSPVNMLVLFFSVMALLVGKIGYLFVAPVAFIFPYIISMNVKIKIKIICILFFILMLLSPQIYLLFERYSSFIATGGNTVKVSGLLLLPYKYIMALFSPFPWYSFKLHYNIYGGNILLFGCHILSSLTGVYFFSRLLLSWKKILFHRNESTNLIIFGSVMSISIILGHTGFHGYLSIFFPFFVPFLLDKKNNLSFLFPLGVAIALNYIMAFLKNDI